MAAHGKPKAYRNVLRQSRKVALLGKTKARPTQFESAALSSP
jgi:hypothetical protein